MPASDEETALSRTVASTATLRLASLHSLDPFYTPLEERFERITRLARRALDVPIAAITVVQDDRQWFKSVSGWHVTELPMSKSLCAEVLREGKQMIVPDTLDDLYMMSNPIVCGKPKIRFYAGYPSLSSMTSMNPAALQSANAYARERGNYRYRRETAPWPPPSVWESQCAIAASLSRPSTSSREPTPRSTKANARGGIALRSGAGTSREPLHKSWTAAFRPGFPIAKCKVSHSYGYGWLHTP